MIFKKRFSKQLFDEPLYQSEINDHRETESKNGAQQMRVVVDIVIGFSC